MAPLEAIQQWLADLNENDRQEISFMLHFLLFDEMPPQEPGAAWQNLEKWLAETVPLKPRLVGKALTFRSCFEHIFANRFSSKGWQETDNFMRGIVEDGAEDPTSEAGQVAGASFQMLRRLPEQEAKWKSIGQSWNQLVADHLTDASLREWQI